MCGDDGFVPLSHLLRALKYSGLWKSDPRLMESMKQIRKYVDLHREVLLTKEMFHDCIRDNVVLIRRAFSGDFVIPAFSDFCAVINDIYSVCRTYSEGKVGKMSNKTEVLNAHCVSKKRHTFYFNCDIFNRCHPSLLIFGRNMHPMNL